MGTKRDGDNEGCEREHVRIFHVNIPRLRLRIPKSVNVGVFHGYDDDDDGTVSVAFRRTIIFFEGRSLRRMTEPDSNFMLGIGFRKRMVMVMVDPVYDGE